MKYVEPHFGVCDNCSKGKCPFYFVHPYGQSAVCSNGGFSSLIISTKEELYEKTHEKK